jgi:hypothetical protein
MLIGDPSVFAIESSITEAYESRGQLALGYFVIHVDGACYGRRAPDSTLLACSFDGVWERIANRGGHTAPFAVEPCAAEIADSVHNAIYGQEQRESHFGMSLCDFVDCVYSNHIIWAPDGDEAFDDGSSVLQFDVVDRIRLIAVRRSDGTSDDLSALKDIWLASELFYNILQQWHEAFAHEWGRKRGRD